MKTYKLFSIVLFLIIGLSFLILLAGAFGETPRYYHPNNPPGEINSFIPYPAVYVNPSNGLINGFQDFSSFGFPFAGMFSPFGYGFPGSFGYPLSGGFNGFNIYSNTGFSDDLTVVAKDQTEDGDEIFYLWGGNECPSIHYALAYAVPCKKAENRQIFFMGESYSLYYSIQNPYLTFYARNI